MAEFLQILSEQYDYPHLADEILRYEEVAQFLPSEISAAKSLIITTARALNP